MRKTAAITILLGTISGCQITIRGHVAIMDLLTVLGFLAAFCLLTMGVVVHYCSSYKAQASWMMRAGASGILLVMIFTGISKAINSASQAEQNQALWGVSKLLLAFLFAWILFRMFRPKPPLIQDPDDSPESAD